MLNSLTPKKLAIFSALAISIIVCIILFVLQQFNLGSKAQFTFPILFLLCFLLSYLLLLFGLERFIYRKIKLIFKRISNKNFSDAEFKTYVNVNEDIVQEVDLEVDRWLSENKQEVESLRKSEQYRKEFIGNVSHELKTPIFTIQGFVETLLDGAYKDEEVFLKYLRKVSKNSDRLIQIINDLQTITELESDRLEINNTKYNIEILTAEVFEDFTKKAKKYNTQLIMNESVENPFMVFADKEKIRQVMVNLIENSIKYGKENGFTKVEFFNMDDKVLIEISDDGIGINKDDKKRLFERFYRVERSRSRDGGGTGLGLSIVKHILEAHNESINVRSNLGEGSTFTFSLQRA